MAVLLLDPKSIHKNINAVNYYGDNIVEDKVFYQQELCTFLIMKLLYYHYL